MRARACHVTSGVPVALLAALLLLVLNVEASRCNPQTVDDPRQSFLSTTPDSPGSVILGRPTDRSIILSIVWREDARVVVRYGPGNKLDKQVGPVVLKSGEPREVTVDNLQPDTLYCYRVVDAATQQPLLPVVSNGRFHTQRNPGKPFVFAVQSDAHLDGNSSLSVYALTLQNALRGEPDFFIDLGDLTMVGKIPDRTIAVRQYLAQRHWLGQIGHSAPVFLALGNHDGEGAFRSRASDADAFAVWASIQRRQYFPNPAPDGFYTGNSQPQQYAGMLQDYYAWEWGEALCVVLDPYWYSSASRGGRFSWNMSLGKIQYDWLTKTLRTSKARFKFVFIHQLTGGLDNSGRGGAEAATLFEWGGREKDGTSTFAVNRPGWEKPIHQLLVETGVTIVFHGHDHFFARQELDGVIYQLVPQPALRNSRNPRAGEYGYVKGEFLPSPGHLRVSVNAKQVKVDYIRTVDQNERGNGIVNGQSAYSYICDGSRGKQ